MERMRKYEAIFIFPPEETPTASKEEEKKLEETIRHLGGRVLDRKDWGRRLLGYPLRKAREGHILLWSFELETARVGELRKALELDEKILKSTIVQAVEPKPVEEPRRTPRHPAERETKEPIHGRQPE